MTTCPFLDYADIVQKILPDMLDYDLKARKPFDRYCITKRADRSVQNWLKYHVLNEPFADANEAKPAFDQLCEILRHYGKDTLPKNFEFSQKEFNEWANRQGRRLPVATQEYIAEIELCGILKHWVDFLHHEAPTDWGFEIRDWVNRWWDKEVFVTGTDLHEAFIELVQLIYEKVGCLEKDFPSFDFMAWVCTYTGFEPHIDEIIESMEESGALGPHPTIQDFERWLQSYAVGEMLGADFADLE